MTQSPHFPEHKRGQESGRGREARWSSICELFEAQAKRTPEAPAAEIDGTALSYDQLNARTNHLAGELRRLGVGPEVVVGVWLERSLESMVALLGVLKAGGVYLPLDPAYPAARLRRMLEDSAAAVVVTAQEPPGRLPLAGIPLLTLDGRKPDAAGEALAELAGPRNLVSCPRSSLPNSPGLHAPGGVAPPRISAASPSLSRLARAADPSPTLATNFWDRTLA